MLRVYSGKEYGEGNLCLLSAWGVSDPRNSLIFGTLLVLFSFLLSELYCTKNNYSSLPLFKKHQLKEKECRGILSWYQDMEGI